MSLPPKAKWVCGGCGEIIENYSTQILDLNRRLHVSMCKAPKISMAPVNQRDPNRWALTYDDYNFLHEMKVACT